MKKNSLILSFLIFIFSNNQAAADSGFSANIKNMEPKGIINVIDEVNYFGDFPKREYQIKNIYIFRQLNPININQRKIEFQEYPQLYGVYHLNLESFDKVTGNFVYKFTITPMALSDAGLKDALYRYNDHSIFMVNSKLFFIDANIAKPYILITGQYKLVNEKPTIIPLDATNYFQLTISGNKLILKQSVINVPVQVVFECY